MQVIISGRGVTLTPAARALVERKLAKLARLLPQIMDARLVCTGEKFRRTVRLTLRAPRRVFASRATNADLTAAIEEAMAAIRRQAEQLKDRRRPRKGGAPSAAITRPA